MGPTWRYYAVYILTNTHHTVLYTGVTKDLRRRLYQHRQGLGSKFTRRYHAHKLVYYELFGTPRLAIAREKQIKAGPRSKKVALIESVNLGGGTCRRIGDSQGVGAPPTRTGIASAASTPRNDAARHLRGLLRPLRRLAMTPTGD